MSSRDKQEVGAQSGNAYGRAFHRDVSPVDRFRSQLRNESGEEDRHDEDKNRLEGLREQHQRDRRHHGREAIGDRPEHVEHFVEQVGGKQRNRIGPHGRLKAGAVAGNEQVHQHTQDHQDDVLPEQRAPSVLFQGHDLEDGEFRCPAGAGEQHVADRPALEPEPALDVFQRDDARAENDDQHRYQLIIADDFAEESPAGDNAEDRHQL